MLLLVMSRFVVLLQLGILLMSVIHVITEGHLEVVVCASA